MGENFKDIVVALINQGHFNYVNYNDEVECAKAIANFINTLESELTTNDSESYDYSEIE
ncbi:hypothetical protein [Clostridium sp.]|uniref:hypothetical protein n=1 Tax=Clostridium sp. TaxID=1506 RepID=UPI003991F01B